MISGRAPRLRSSSARPSTIRSPLIADKLGVKEAFTEGKTQEEWIKELYEKSRAKDTALPTYEEAMEMGVYTRKNPKGATIALAEKWRQDPEANKLMTPTGKVEDLL